MILDLHVHSMRSYDSLSKPKDILRTAKRKGLSGIAVTDHDTILGAEETKRANDDGSFSVIIAAEYATPAGDIIGLFLSENLRVVSDPLETVDRIHSQGGLAVIPHPLKGHKLTDDLVRRVDAIEGFNSRVSQAQNLAAQELGRKFGKAILAGSDAHFRREIGLARTTTETQDIRSDILRGAVKCEAISSSKYNILMSQAIKAVKRKRYLDLPKGAIKVLGKESGRRGTK